MGTDSSCCIAAGRAGKTSGKTFTIDVTDAVNAALNGKTDSRTALAFMVARIVRRNPSGSGSSAIAVDAVGSNRVVRLQVFLCLDMPDIQAVQMEQGRPLRLPLQSWIAQPCIIAVRSNDWCMWFSVLIMQITWQ